MSRLTDLEDRCDELEADGRNTAREALQLVRRLRAALQATPVTDLDYIVGDEDAPPQLRLLRVAEVQRYQIDEADKLAEELVQLLLPESESEADRYFRSIKADRRSEAVS